MFCLGLTRFFHIGKGLQSCSGQEKDYADGLMLNCLWEAREASRLPDRRCSLAPRLH